MDDIRYSEFLFLQGVTMRQIPYFYHGDSKQLNLVGLHDTELYLEMAVAALEHLHIQFKDYKLNRLGLRLRGDIDHESSVRLDFPNIWQNPRDGLHDLLARSSNMEEVRITYRGLQRIEELRDLLRRDDILEPLGVLLDKRYLRRDLQDALHRAAEVSVIYADMDNFKRINDNFGHAAGDVVMKTYLENVRDGLGQFGTGFRGLGDEAVGLIVGQGHLRAVEIAENIRSRVAAMECEYKGTRLPSVTASIGVATTPPADRTPEVEMLADQRQKEAKKGGKNRVVAE